MAYRNLKSAGKLGIKTIRESPPPSSSLVCSEFPSLFQSGPLCYEGPIFLLYLSVSAHSLTSPGVSLDSSLSAIQELEKAVGMKLLDPEHVKKEEARLGKAKAKL